jgi:phage-related protein
VWKVGGDHQVLWWPPYAKQPLNVNADRRRVDGQWFSPSSLVADVLDTTVKCLNLINYVWKVGGDHQVIWLPPYAKQPLNINVD